MHRVILHTILGFVAFALLGYIGVTAAIFGAWAVIGVQDRDGGAGMAVVYGLAPVVAAVSGVIGAALAARRAIRHPRGDSTQERDGRDRHLLAVLIGVVVGLFLGLQGANLVQALLRPLIFESRIIFRAFELAHEVFIPFGALAGGWLASRWEKRRRIDDA